MTETAGSASHAQARTHITAIEAMFLAMSLPKKRRLSAMRVVALPTAPTPVIPGKSMR